MPSTSVSHGVLLDHAQDKIVLLDETGRVTYANRAVEELLGYDPVSFVGENAFEYVHPDDVAGARRAFRETVESDTYECTTAEYRYRAADGSWVWVESRMSNLTDERLDGYVVSSRDVTDRKRAERERHNVAERLRELSSATGEVLWLFDGDFSELLFVNPAYETVFGGSIAAIKADPMAFLDVIHPEDVPLVESGIERLAAGESTEMEYRVNPERGYRTWVWAQGEPIIEDGEVVRIAGFCRDVTDRRRRERQLYVMDNLLRHNLRNDLNVVLGNAELIESETPAAAERTAVIRRTAEGLLASAEKEREVIELLIGEPATCSLALAEVANEAVDAVRERYPDARIVVDAEPVEVVALEEIGLAVVELVENALVHATTDRPVVEVTVRTEPDGVVLTVADEGPPIPDVEAQVLDGRHEMTDVYHSTGLGLWLVHWAVELSGGDVTVERDDTGNRVRVRLDSA